MRWFAPAVALVLTAATARADDDEAAALLEDAEDELDGGRWESCVATLLSGPESAESRWMLARCYEQGGLYLEARDEAARAAEMARAEGRTELATAIEAHLAEIDANVPRWVPVRPRPPRPPGPVPPPEDGPTFTAVAELSVYQDDDEVRVISPALTLAAADPASGWGGGAEVIVDAISAASADLLSSGAERDDTRFAATGAIGYDIAGDDAPPVRIGVHGGVSLESDYVARMIGGSVSADLFYAMISPYVRYDLALDLIGRHDTDFDVFSRDLTCHTIELGSSVLLDPAAVVWASGSVGLLDGDSSRPDRRVALFPREFAGRIPEGASPELVEAARSSISPLERLPSERQRYAGQLGAGHRFDTVTLRVSGRVVLDSWDQLGETGDVRVFWDATDWLRLGAHERFHYQRAVDFWRRTYLVEMTPSGTLQVPEHFSGDRDLGPLLTETFGLSGRFEATDWLAFQALFEGSYTRFLDHLYITERVGLFTTLGVELGFQSSVPKRSRPAGRLPNQL